MKSFFYGSMELKNSMEHITVKKISIITVVYNGENTIEQTIKSVISQKEADVEYIIIDGNSTDRTQEIIRKYIRDIDVYLCEEDDGLYDAMNKGIFLAKGEIIGILNSDDIYAEGTLGKVKDTFAACDVDVVYGNALRFEGVEKRVLYSCDNIDELWYRMAIPHPAAFVKKSAYLEHGAFDVQYELAADYELMLRFYSKKLRFKHISDILTYFRVGGVSDQNKIKCSQEARSIALKYIMYCSEKEKWIPIIHNNYYRNQFTHLLESNDDTLLDALHSFLLPLNKKSIVIWGIGKMGMICLKTILKSDIKIDYIVDNNSTIWGKENENIKVVSPDNLHNYRGGVLIATYKDTEEIRKQLGEIDDTLEVFTILDWTQKTLQLMGEF